MTKHYPLDWEKSHFSYREARENVGHRFPDDAELLAMALEAEGQARVALDRFERMQLEERVREFAREFSRRPRGAR